MPKHHQRGSPPKSTSCPAPHRHLRRSTTSGPSSAPPLRRDPPPPLQNRRLQLQQTTSTEDYPNHFSSLHHLQSEGLHRPWSIFGYLQPSPEASAEDRLCLRRTFPHRPRGLRRTKFPGAARGRLQPKPPEHLATGASFALASGESLESRVEPPEATFARGYQKKRTKSIEKKQKREKKKLRFIEAPSP